MRKNTSIRIDEAVTDYVLTFDAEYGFKSLGALINGILYYAKYQTNPEYFDVQRFLEDTLDGKLVTPDKTDHEIKLQKTLEIDQFCAYMDREWGNQMLSNIILRSMQYWMDKTDWQDRIRREFCQRYDIPLYPWEVRKYIQLWYDRADQTGRLREINRCIILKQPITEQTFLDCDIPAEQQGGTPWTLLK